MSFEELSYIDVKHCPQCLGEFVARLDNCPDCEVRLTYSNPAVIDSGAPAAVDAEPVEIFSTMEVGLLPLVQATLEEAGVAFRTIERFVSQAVFGSVLRETGFLVPAADADRARAALAELPSESPGSGPSSR